MKTKKDKNRIDFDQKMFSNSLIYKSSSFLSLFFAMKAFLLLLYFCLCVCSDLQQLELKFTSYQQQFSKVYVDETERNYRLKIFNQNLEYIKEQNNKQKSYTLGITPFTDLTNEEFKERFVLNVNIMKKRESMRLPTEDSATILKESKSTLPTIVDWVSKKAVTFVKNQASCGSCWAFSTVGAIEGAYAIHSGELESLSPQNLVDCDTTDNGCSGGLMSNAFEYVMLKGVTTEKNYPYEGTEGSCKNPTDVKKILGYFEVPPGSSYEMKRAISRNPVSVAIEADSDVFQHYTGGVLDNSSCGTSLNHGVLVVGYDTTSRVPYYVVKNSWGSNWGENGFVRLAITDSYAGMCGIHLMGSYPFLDL